MKFSEMMKTTNRLIKEGVKELNKADCETVFGTKATENLKEELEYLGWTVQRVADIFNAKLPEERFTKAEIEKQVRIEKTYLGL